MLEVFLLSSSPLPTHFRTIKKPALPGGVAHGLKIYGRSVVGLLLLSSHFSYQKLEAITVNIHDLDGWVFD
jgi:hypothetical protein